MPKDYSHLNKEELLKTVAELEDKVKHRYGLVWDEEQVREKFEQDAENAYPVLREIKSRIVSTDETKPINIMIEGDNYHALSVLQYTHQRKIDLIYIDPPYNTGAQDWKYNNKFVDRNDTWRHSKWLNFMNNRLRLTKNLLVDDGVLIVAIDDYEINQLGLLLDKLFPTYEKDVIVVKHHPQGAGSTTVSRTHEYAFVCIPPTVSLFGKKSDGDQEDKWSLKRSGQGENNWRKNRPKSFFPILVDVKKRKVVGVGPELKSNERYPKGKTPDGYIRIYPIDRNGGERVWRYNRSTMDRLITEGKIEYTERGSLVVTKTGDVASPVFSVWDGSRYNAGTNGTALIAQILGDSSVFSYPKSLYTVLDMVEMVVRNKRNAIILDYFAGSGTTGHAVLELNKQDSGARQFILCTNNENNIATGVCFPRIEKVIRGYKKNGNGEKVDGLGGNLRYFKTAFVKQSIGRDELRIRITHECTEMLCIREGIYEEQKAVEAYKIFTQGNRIMAVYYDMDRKALKKLQADLSKYSGEKILYCFTLDPLGLDQSDFADWTDVRLEPIPQKILDVYEEINELHS
jgi:adenine-specific DNA-methyltransferase